MDQLLLPDGLRPVNLHLTPSHKVRYVDNDMFHIAERIREISPRLYILELEQNSAEGSKFGYAIMEQCRDGVDRLVFRTPKDGLTGVVLDRLRMLMAQDLHTRLAILDKEREVWEADNYNNDMERLYETLGGPMEIELERTGHLQRPISYPKMNPTARRHGRRMT